MREPDALAVLLVAFLPVAPDRQDLTALLLDGDDVRRCDVGVVRDLRILERHLVIDVVLVKLVDLVVLVNDRHTIVGDVLHILVGEADILVRHDLRTRNQECILQELPIDLGALDVVALHRVLVRVPGR